MSLLNILPRKSLECVRSNSIFQGCRAAQRHGLKTLSLPDLPYDYGALEPVISGEIMKIHHQKHHQTYVTNYNTALQKLDAAMDKGDSSTVVQLQSAIKFNGGDLSEEGGGEPPKDALGCAIDTHFGSLENLMSKMNAEGAALQGSGWVDPLVTKRPALVPILGIDVWEHAYYLQYKNVKMDYLQNIWKIINWKYAGKVYNKELL